MDTEDAIAPMNRTSQLGLTQMAQSARDAFDSTPGLSGVLVTFDVGWAPNVDGESCHDMSKRSEPNSHN